MKCKDVMTTNVSCCLATDPVSEAAHQMRDRQVGPVPVLDDLASRHVAGILTDRDIAVKVVAEGRDPDATPVSLVMTNELVTCHPEDDVDDAMEAMSHRLVRRVLVVDERGTLQGIISQADIATRVNNNKKTGEIVREISHAHL
jgi:CBS domain-containing protein